jgi:hypothetical protein
MATEIHLDQSKCKVEYVMDLINLEKPSILPFHETKLATDEALSKCKKLWKSSEGQAISTRGASRGISIVWNISILLLNHNKKYQQWLMTSLTH